MTARDWVRRLAALRATIAAEPPESREHTARCMAADLELAERMVRAAVEAAEYRKFVRSLLPNKHGELS